MKHHLTPNKVGFVIAMAMLLAVFNINGYFKPVPYGQVEILSVTEEEGRIYFKANFIKVECEFKALRVQTEHFSQWDETPWSNEDSHTADDRMAGEETLSISFAGSSETVDRVQIKTRHTCDGEKVDKTFALFTLSDHIK